jgi:hypothetical protein
MLRRLSIILVLLISGCAVAPKPVMSPPPPCEIMVAGKCQSMSAQQKAGATSLGHHEEQFNEKP